VPELPVARRRPTCATEGLRPLELCGADNTDGCQPYDKSYHYLRSDTLHPTPRGRRMPDRQRNHGDRQHRVHHHLLVLCPTDGLRSPALPSSPVPPTSLLADTPSPQTNAARTKPRSPPEYLARRAAPRGGVVGGAGSSGPPYPHWGGRMAAPAGLCSYQPWY
jgi:hypothetical protein